MAPTAEVIRSPAELGERDREGWDAMAVAHGHPFRLSAWQLASGEHVDAGAPLHLVLLRDGAELAGVAGVVAHRRPGPLWLHHYLQLGWNFGHDVGPLARPGHEDALARALAEHLRGQEPPPSMVTLCWDAEGSQWPARFRRAWGRPTQDRLEGRHDCPVVTLDPGGDADRWAAGRSRNFREAIKRRRKLIARRGGVVRRTEDLSQLRGDVSGLFAAHRARFATLAKRSALTERHEAAVQAAAPALLAAGHLRLWVVEHEGEIVGAQLHLRAGDGLAYWNGGMVAGWERESPGLVLLDAAVRDGHALGARRLDLGPGLYDYKLRFADTSAGIASHDVLPLTPRYPLVRARLAPKHLGALAREQSRRLPDERREQLKRLVGR